MGKYIVGLGHGLCVSLETEEAGTEMFSFLLSKKIVGLGQAGSPCRNRIRIACITASTTSHVRSLAACSAWFKSKSEVVQDVCVSSVLRHTASRKLS